MEMWVKLVMIAAVVVGDAIAMAVVGPRLIREGKQAVVGIMGGAFLLTTFVLAYVLFVLVE